MVYDVGMASHQDSEYRPLTADELAMMFFLSRSERQARERGSK